MAFRHELAREAVYATVAPARRQELHRKALQALEARMSAQHDAAGATHHAAAAGDIDAVVRYAPQAALLASIAGSRREAVAHLTLALRYADRLPVPERRDLFIRLGEQLDRLGQDVASVSAYRSALELTDDDAGRVEIWLKLWTPLSTSGSVEAAIDVLNAATAVLEAGPPSAQLGSVFAYRCSAHMLARQFALAEEWGQRAMAIAAEYDDVETLAYVRIQSGVARWMQGDPEGMPRLQAGVSLARDHGIDALVARGLQQVGSGGGENRWYDEAIPALEKCIAFAAAHELGAPERYATAWLGRCQVELGEWAAAALTLQRVVDAARADRITRVTATTALGRLHARRGDADPWERLDAGLVLARESGHLQRLWPVAAARCEAAWLEGRLPDELDNLTAVYELALGLDQPWATEELAFWLWRGGHAVSVAVPRTPFADHLGGDYELAARKWEALGCPYEQATALADSASDEHQRAALAIFADLGAAPASRRLIEQRRRAGRAVPRGPNAATRGNAGGLTGRELDVLRLVAVGRTNAEIAAELVMSPRTVGHHVSHILAKLEASNRAEAVSLAARAGVELRTI